MAKRAIPEVNAGSMADIAFLLLIFFLVTTTIETNAGIITKLPPKVEKPDTPPVNKRNLFIVMVNKYNQILVTINDNSEVTNIKDLRKKAKDFLDNGGGVADKECKYCKGAKSATSSENPNDAIISLQNDREASYSTYIAVQNELIAAYNELRERERLRLFPNEVTYIEMDAEFNAARTPKERKDALKPKIEELQKLFPRKLVEASIKK